MAYFEGAGVHIYRSPGDAVRAVEALCIASRAGVVAQEITLQGAG